MPIVESKRILGAALVISTDEPTKRSNDTAYVAGRVIMPSTFPGSTAIAVAAKEAGKIGGAVGSGVGIREPCVGFVEGCLVG